MLPRLGVPSWTKLVAGILGLLLLLILTATGVYGFQQGRSTSLQQQEQFVQELRDQMDQGIKSGHLELALWAGEQLEALDRLSPARQAQMQQIRERQQPAPTAVAIPTPTAVPPTPSNQHELWIEAQTAFQAGAWEQTIQNLTALRAVDEQYVTVGYLTLLEEAHIYWARDLIAQNRHEEALMQLQVALALRQSERVEDEIAAAHRMTESLSFWGVDWELVIGTLQQVYAYDPTYADVSDRLVRALQLYHDSAVARQEYCSGHLFFISLGALVAEMDMTFLQEELQRQCRAATS